MSNFSFDLPLSEDDIVINIRYLFTYYVPDGLLSLDNDLVENEIRSTFNNYSFNNAIRINDIFIESRSVSIIVKLLNPDIPPLDISENVRMKLNATLSRFDSHFEDDIWQDTGIFTVGTEEDAEADIEEYLRRMRTCQNEESEEEEEEEENSD